MKDMYNKWRSDVHEWMNESTLNRYDDLKKAGIHNQNTIKFIYPSVAVSAIRLFVPPQSLTLHDVVCGASSHLLIETELILINIRIPQHEPLEPSWLGLE